MKSTIALAVGIVVGSYLMAYVVVTADDELAGKLENHRQAYRNGKAAIKDTLGT